MKGQDGTKAGKKNEVLYFALRNRKLQVGGSVILFFLALAVFGPLLTRYEPMAMSELQLLVAETASKWPILRCYVEHRLGEVAVGEASVVIGVSSAHRAEAFAACRFLIDETKARIPIWKQELFEDGSTEWVSGAQPTDA